MCISGLGVLYSLVLEIESKSLEKKLWIGGGLKYKTKHDQEIYLLLVLFKTNCERGLNLYRKIKSQIFKLMEALQ